MKPPFGLGPRPGLVLGVVAVLLGLGVFYWFQTQENRAQLNQRNLRDLARIARGIEAKTNNLEEIVAGQRAPDRCTEEIGSRVPHAVRCDLLRPRSDAGVSSAGSPDVDADGPVATCTEPPAGATAMASALWLHANGTSVCVARRGEGAGPRSMIAAVEFDLVGLLEPAMTSSFFEEVFIADRDGRVLLQPGSGGHRLRTVPAPVVEEGADPPEPSRNSDAYRARVGGRMFRVFIQPVDLRIPGPRTDASGGDGQATGGSTRWQVGGLVDAGRFRSEALALDTGKLSILLLVTILTVLAWPFLKLWSMGEREAVASRDLLFLGFSFVLGSGLVAICVFDLAFYWQLRHTFDDQLAAVGEEMALNVHREVGFALQELDGLSARFHASLTGDGGRGDLPAALAAAGLPCPDRDGQNSAGSGGFAAEVYGCLAELRSDSVAEIAAGVILPRDAGIPAGAPLIHEGPCLPWIERGADAAGSGCASPAGSIGTLFPYFEMAIWVNPEGFQVAKWSPGDEVTSRRSVAHREYFRRVQTGELWRWSELDPPGPGEAVGGASPRDVAYFLEVVRSINTGEILVALSTPYDPWRAARHAAGEHPPVAAPSGFGRWAATMTTKLASLDQPVLPPGFGFAVIDGDGRVLFHSLTERALEANFFEETAEDAALRSTVLARAESHRSLRYLGRDIRLFVTPVRGTPLSLIAYHDWAYPGTIAFESLAVALILFGGFVLLLLALAVGVHLCFPYHLGWSWPGVWLDGRHRVLLFIFALLAAGGVIQAREIADATAVDQYMVHMLAGTYLLAVLAVAATLLVPARRRGQTVLGLALAAVAGGLLLEGALDIERGWGGFVPQHPLLLAPLVSAVVAAVLFSFWFRKRAAFAPWLTGPRWLERNLYPVTMLAGLLVVGTLPAALSFTIIAADHVELLVKHNQLYMVDALDRRETRIRAEHRPWGQGGGTESPILLARRDGLPRGGPAGLSTATPFDVIVSPAFETCYKLPDPDRAPTEPPDWRCGRASPETPAVHAWRMPEGTVHDRLLHLILDRVLPYFTEVSVRTRHLYHDHAASPHEIEHEDHGTPSGRRPRIALASDGGVPATDHEFDRGWWWSVHEDHPSIDSIVPVSDDALRVGFAGVSASGAENQRILLDYRPADDSIWSTRSISPTSDAGTGARHDGAVTVSGLSPHTPYAFRLRVCGGDGAAECFSWSAIRTGSTRVPAAGPGPASGGRGPATGDAEGVHGEAPAARGHEEEGHPILLSVGPPRQNYAVFSRLPEGFGIPDTGWWAVLLGGLAALFYLIRFISRKVFLSDCHPTEAVTVRELARGGLDHPTLIVTPWKGDRDVLRDTRDDVVTIDLRELRRRSGDGPIDVDLPSRDRLLAIDGLDEVLDDPGWSGHLLDWLEELHVSGRSMVLLADRDPAGILFRNGGDRPGRDAPSGNGDTEPQDEAASKPVANQKNRERWLRLFSSFTRVVAGRPEPARTNAPRREVSFAFGDLWIDEPEGDRKTRNEWLLERECGITAALRPVEEHVRRHPEFGSLSDDALVGLLKDASAGQYERVWDAIGEEERMTLAQIAYGAVSLPKRRRAVTHLLSLGLLERRPGLELMNRSFADFVRDAVPPGTIAAWEKAGDVSVWQTVRQPLLITLVAVALFLFVTQRDLFNTGIAFVTAAAAGVPSLFRLLGAVRTGRQGK